MVTQVCLKGKSFLFRWGDDILILNFNDTHVTFFLNQRACIMIALLKFFLFLLGTVSKVSDVAHGPLLIFHRNLMGFILILSQIFNALPKDLMSRPLLETYLSLICDDSVRTAPFLFFNCKKFPLYIKISELWYMLNVCPLCFVFQTKFLSRVGDSGGGMYAISILCTHSTIYM